MSQTITKKVYLGSDTNGIDISDRITRLLFAESIKQDDSLELYAQGEDARYLLELNEVRNGAPVIFNFGYVGGAISPTFRAVISDIEPDYTTDGLNLVIKCGDRGRTLRKSRSKKVWKKKKTDQIFKEIADIHGLNTYIEIPAGGFLEWASLPQESKTYMDFLQMLAAKEKDGNYICFVSGDDLHLVTRNLDEISKNTITVGQDDNLIRFSIRWRETTAPDSANEVGAGAHKVNVTSAANNIVLGNTGIYTATGAVYLKDKSGQRTLLIREDGRFTPEARKVLGKDALTTIQQTTKDAAKYASANPQNVQKVGTATYVPLSKNRETTVNNALASITNGSELFAPESQEEQETKNHANSIHKTAAQKVLTAELQEYGNPFRRMNTIITVAGVATRFVGNWLIETVSHEVGSGDYITKCMLSKNGLKKGGVPVKGTTNTKAGDKKNDDKVYIGLQGADNGRAYKKNTVTGEKKTIEYKPNKQP